MSTDGQRTKCSRNITENYNRLSPPESGARPLATDDKQTGDSI